MTRVLFVGDVRPWTRTEQRLRALRQLVEHVDVVPTEPDDGAPPGTRRPSLRARVARRLGRPLDATNAVRGAQAVLDRGDVDLLWIEKALALDPALVADARVPAVFVSEDDMAQRHNQSRNFRAALPHYRLVVTTKPRNAGPLGLARIGARRVLVLPKAFDPELHRPRVVTQFERQAFGSELAFVGTYEAPRARSLSRLADAGFDVRVWGNGWRGRRVSPRLRVEGRAAHGLDYGLVLNASLVHLGFLRRANGDLSTGRSVEVPAAGAFLLTERTTEHSALFREGVEAEFFGDDDELSSKARAALRDPVRRATIAAAGRRRVLDDERSHETAVRRILAALEDTP
ncbi:MAG: glycosyltransferase [Planctomycetota bacterium]